MAVNEKIIQEIEKKTENDPGARKFLIDLLKYELETHGWYTKEYHQRIENAVKEEQKNAL